MSKKCRQCKIEKDRSEYSNNQWRKTNVSPTCNICLHAKKKCAVCGNNSVAGKFEKRFLDPEQMLCGGCTKEILYHDSMRRKANRQMGMTGEKVLWLSKEDFTLHKSLMPKPETYPDNYKLWLRRMDLMLQAAPTWYVPCKIDFEEVQKKSWNNHEQYIKIVNDLLQDAIPIMDREDRLVVSNAYPMGYDIIKSKMAKHR